MSIAGTIATDGLHDDLGWALWIEIVIFFVLMSATFAAWLMVEGTLAVHSIYTLRRELFYWVAILWSFALGTAVGDAIIEVGNVSFGETVGIFVGIMAFIFLLWLALQKTGYCTDGSATEIGLFWAAYIMTRPLGASFGNLLASDQADGGAGLGTTAISLILLAIIAACNVYCMFTRCDIMPPGEVPVPQAPSVELLKHEVAVSHKA